MSWAKQITSLIKQTGIRENAIQGDLNRFKHKAEPLFIGLLGVIKRPDNPFRHENAVVKLLQAALKDKSAFLRDIDITNCKVKCTDWTRIQSLQEEVEIELTEQNDECLYPIPDWVNEDNKPLYRVGMFLRSCLIGHVDWTSLNHLDRSYSGYRGVKTSFLKRQLGMTHAPTALQGEAAAMTGWLTGLLFHLLQWPGAKTANGNYLWPSQWDLTSLKKLIDERIEFQRTCYCELSDMPGYIERIQLDWDKTKKTLKVVMVQSLLPINTDFASRGFKLETSLYRARHRRHIAAVAELLLHKVVSQNSIFDEPEKRKSDIDLIVWPELSIHKDDIDILERLSDKTGAIIYAGLVFLDIPGHPGPINTAIWIVPKKDGDGRQFMFRFQGKQNMMKDEIGHVKSWRPYQLILELIHPAFPDEPGFMLTGSICYDATDISLSADLRDKSNAYIVCALNKDVNTFDTMIDALHYHMFQPVVLVNTGAYGGSCAKAPYRDPHLRLISHCHGNNQVSISTFEMNMFDFRRDSVGKSMQSGNQIKTQPAGVRK
ncbi:hypothetical protein CKQ84_23580 [Shewanella sp. WE21]|jgi:hypothetical protein|uniref:hypothetical protein n=2 Tax=unclassified Shewanella TaxID=196818 RepID=UPI000CF63C0F|nr:hypothetical protein [Shewanella sp. WE21]AVI68569.1 hypothetical protein CKQ84_23580 [Shewanella sp. WE21]